MNTIIFAALLGVMMMFASVWIANKSLYRHIAAAGLLVLLVLNVYETYNAPVFSIDTRNMLSFQKFGLFFNSICIGATLIYILLSGQAIDRVGTYGAEYYTLIFFVLCGIGLLTSFDNLLTLFLGIEILSIPLYILTGANKKNLRSIEAALKYFLMGSFSTGILLMGIALLYGATGSFALEPVRQGLTGPLPLSILEVSGCLLMLIAFAFKVSAAPFHFWTPDVYDGAPAVFTSFMATIVKAAGFFAMVHFFESRYDFTNVTANANIGVNWKLLFSILIVATLFVGNITAVFQQSVKRMLAYSSIAQAGFMLFAVFSISGTAKEGLVLYAAAYSLATIGIFALLVRMKDVTFDAYAGLGKSEPALAFANTVFLLSLAGIPLTGGFFAKYFMLANAVQAGGYLWLVIAAVIFAAISVYYYFRVIQAMYFKTGDEPIQVAEPVSIGFKAGLLGLAALLIALGVWPQLLLNYLYF